MLSVTHLIQQGNELKAHFTYTSSNDQLQLPSLVWIHSMIYTINKINFQIKIGTNERLMRFGQNLLFAKITTVDDTIPYSVKISSTSLQINRESGNCSNEWFLICDAMPKKYFDIKVEVYQHGRFKDNPFAPLHENSILTDFELCGSDGSVRFNSTVLALSVPVLGRMLEGKWWENESRQIDIPVTTKETLGHLKNYIYLGILPETGIEELLLLASYYMMDELEDKCVTRLVNNTKPEDAIELTKFAVSNNMNKLYRAFLERVEEGGIEVEKLPKLV